MIQDALFDMFLTILCVTSDILQYRCCVTSDILQCRCLLEIIFYLIIQKTLSV